MDINTLILIVILGVMVYAMLSHGKPILSALLISYKKRLSKSRQS